MKIETMIGFVAGLVIVNGIWVAIHLTGKPLAEAGLLTLSILKPMLILLDIGYFISMARICTKAFRAKIQEKSHETF